MDKKEYITRKIKDTKGAPLSFVKVYNTVCSMCRLKLIKSKGSMPWNQYCKNCREKIEPILAKLKEKMEK